MPESSTPSGCGTCSYCNPAPSDVTHFHRWAPKHCERQPATEQETPMTEIAPVLFTAHREEASAFDEPNLLCFNAGAPVEGIDALRAPYALSRYLPVAGTLGVLGILGVAMGACALIGNLASHRPDPFRSLGWVDFVAGPACVLFVVGVAWAAFLLSERRPRAKAWQAALGEAWLTYGGQVFNLNRLEYEERREVTGYAVNLEEIRNGLNQLDPEGDELDGARYALERYIEACDIPLLGKRAAEAKHIKDPVVRQAAKEYEAAVARKDHLRRALDAEEEQARDLLGTRQQAKSDAELIRWANER